MAVSLPSRLIAWLFFADSVIGSSIGSSNTGLLLEIARAFGCQVETSAIECIFQVVYPPKAGFGEKRAKVGQTNLDVYGEVLVKGTQELIEAVPEVGVASDDVFFDLGSGTGKATMQVFLTSPVRRAVGVELDIGRHDHGSQALASLKKILPSLGDDVGRDVIRHGGRELELVNGDILQTNLNEATVIFIASLAFPAKLLEELQSHLLESALPGTVVMLQTKLPGCPRRFLHLADVKVAVSWAHSTTIYIYLITTPIDMSPLVESSGSAAIGENQWGAAATQLQRLRARTDIDKASMALHQERGNKQSHVECDASNLIVTATRKLSDANKSISRLDLERTDHFGRQLLWYVCDAHSTAEHSARSMFGNDGGFAAHQKEKQRRLFGLTEMLLQRRANANLPDHKGQTVLQEASSRGDSVLLSLLQGASISSVHAGEL